MAAARGVAEEAPVGAVFVVVPERDVPDGMMPRGVTAVVTVALEHGFRVRSTYAAAFVGGVLKRLEGSEKSVDSEAPAHGAKSTRITVLHESIAVRVWREGAAPGCLPSSGPERAWAMWVRRDQESWKSTGGQVRESGAWPRDVGVKELVSWIIAFGT